MLHLICNDIPVDGQLHLRFLNIFVNNLKSDNTCVKLCALLCLRGSRSEASDSLNFISTLYSLDKFNIVDISVMNRIIEVNCPISAGAINDRWRIVHVRSEKHQLYVGWTESFIIFFLDFFLIKNCIMHWIVLPALNYSITHCILCSCTRFKGTQSG